MMGAGLVLALIGFVWVPLIPIGLLLLLVGALVGTVRQEPWTKPQPRTEGRVIDRTGLIGKPKHIYCPRCCSAEFQPVKKGFSVGKAAAGGLLFGPMGLLGGMIGANQPQLVCLRCGNRWFPRRQVGGGS